MGPLADQGISPVDQDGPAASQSWEHNLSPSRAPWAASPGIKYIIGMMARRCNRGNTIFLHHALPGLLPQASNILGMMRGVAIVGIQFFHITAPPEACPGGCSPMGIPFPVAAGDPLGGALFNLYNIYYVNTVTCTPAAVECNIPHKKN